MIFLFMYAPVLLLAAALLVGTGWASLPFPYTGLYPQDVPRDILDKLPAWPVDLEESTLGVNRKLLTRAGLLFEGQIPGSESVALSQDGKTLYMADKYGWVHLAHDHELVPNYTYIGPGRPLGIAVGSEQTLLVCDSLKGLIEVRLPAQKGGQAGIRILSNVVRGVPFHYANSLALDRRTGDVYFTASTARPVVLNTGFWYDTMWGYMMDAMHGVPAGRVLRYNPGLGETEVVADGIWFANGVALGRDGKYVYYVETSALRVMRKSLERPDVPPEHVASFPAYPDGLTAAPDGSGFWVSLCSPYSALFLLMPYPALRSIISYFLPVLTPVFVKSIGLVVKISPQGEILDVLMDPKGERVRSVSATAVQGNRLYMGSLMGDSIAYYDLD